MKKVLFLLLFLGTTALMTEANAQIKTPSASPKCVTTQTVGLTDITVEYARPGVKDRTIFAKDGLVPFGKIWRTGANAATKITFSQDVIIEGNEIEAGSYAILSIPNAEMWEIHMHKHESTRWSNYKDATPAVKFRVKSQKTPMSIETMLITFDNISSESATCEILWENTYVGFDIKTKTDETVMENIKKVMSGPNANDYYAAGSYMYDSKKDLNEALKYVQKATKSDEPKFWQVRKESLILAELGRYKEAIEAAMKSLELAKKAENADYIRMNEKSIAEWKTKN